MTFNRRQFVQGAAAAAAASMAPAAFAADTVAATRINSVVGPVHWGGAGPMKNVSKTPLVLGQWTKGTKNKVELVIVNNEAARSIPTGATLKLI